MNKEEVKDVKFSTQKMKEDIKENEEVFVPDMCHLQIEKDEIDEYRNRISSIYYDAAYLKINATHWLSNLSDKLEGYHTVEVTLLREKERLLREKEKLEEKEQELKAQKDELFLKEKNIRTADAATCVNINKLINKTEDILGELKDEKEKMKLFEGNMYTNEKEEDNKEKCDVGEVSKKQRVLTIVVIVVFLGLLGFVLCVK